MAINKESIHELVEVFYQPTFKTFYVNSSDGNTFQKPLGVFVSLGITTSLRVLRDIKDILDRSKGLSACLAEIKSIKVAKQFINTVVNDDESTISQYKMKIFPENCYGRDESLAYLESLKATLSVGLGDLSLYAMKISKLTDMIEKLELNPFGWDEHLIHEVDGDFRVFHRFVNYQVSDNAEFRIGIYVKQV